jgi:uncharacterized protein DUF3467
MSRSRKSLNGDCAPLACYSNYFEIAHNEHEFLIGFFQYDPATSKAAPVSKIAIGPTLAKVLHEMLNDAVAKYEAEHGPLQSLSDSPDALQTLLQSFPEFEQRALDARLRRLSDPAAPKRTSRKR